MRIRGQVISFPDIIFGERQRYARPSQTLFFGSILQFTKLDDMKKLILTILPRTQSLVAVKG